MYFGVACWQSCSRISKLGNGECSMTNKNLIFRATCYIPKSKVLTYGGLAQLTGLKNPRAVGTILHQNSNPKKIPCHRVVNAQGRLAKKYAFGGESAQMAKLKKEGVEFVAVGGKRSKNSKKVNLACCLWQPHQLLKLFFRLLRQYGEPGHWPWFGTGYRHTPEQIAIGAILTQNVSWRNVEIALDNLRQARVNNLSGIYQLGVQKSQKKLKQLIRPAGFYNQKAKYLFEFSRFITEKFGSLSHFFKQSFTTARRQLLKIYGIGPETADTILLYAGNKPIFVIDAYTAKFIEHYGLCQDLKYKTLQKFSMDNLPKDAKLYQDYHALIVKWGKCQPQPNKLKSG